MVSITQLLEQVLVWRPRLGNIEIEILEKLETQFILKLKDSLENDDDDGDEDGDADHDDNGDNDDDDGDDVDLILSGEWRWPRRELR